MAFKACIRHMSTPELRSNLQDHTNPNTCKASPGTVFLAASVINWLG